jgi:hypothetical protein
MIKPHLPLIRTRRFALLVLALALLLVALPASRAGAAASTHWRSITWQSNIFAPDTSFSGQQSYIYHHQNGFCADARATGCYQWRSSPGANNFIVYGPYETLPPGIYRACWHVADDTPGPGPYLWMQSTANSGATYLGGTAPQIAAGFNTYCYWFGQNGWSYNVEYRAIMGQHNSNSVVAIGYPLEVTRYY